MSIEALHWAFAQRGISDGCARLLHVLADYADELGMCWPARNRLAERVEKSPDTVDRRLSELAEAQLLCKATRTRPGVGGRVVTLSNAYFLHLKGAKACRNCAAPDAEQPGRKSAAPLAGQSQPRDGAAAGRKSAAPPASDTGRNSAAGRDDAAEGAAAAAARGAAYGAAHMESFTEPSGTTLTERPRMLVVVDRILAEVAHPKLGRSQGLVLGTHWLANWERLGVTVEEVIEIVRAVMADRDAADPGADEVSTWKFFDRRVRRFARDKTAANAAEPLGELNDHTTRYDNVRPLNAAERQQAATLARRASWGVVLAEGGGSDDAGRSAGDCADDPAARKIARAGDA